MSRDSVYRILHKMSLESRSYCLCLRLLLACTSVCIVSSFTTGRIFGLQRRVVLHSGIVSGISRQTRRRRVTMSAQTAPDAYACCPTCQTRSEYCVQYGSQKGGEELDAIEKKTCSDLKMDYMIAGKLSVQVLGMLISISKAKRVLELGAYSGFTAVAMAHYLPADGKLVTIDPFTAEPESEAICRDAIEKSSQAHKIEVIKGEGLAVLAQLTESKVEPFDFVFIDADKESQIPYYERLFDETQHPLLSPDGVVTIDNTLWYSKVVREESKQDDVTRCIHEFNVHVAKDPRTQNVILNVRDGISVVRRAT